MRSRRFLFTLVALSFFTLGAFAQEINGGVNLSFPTGTTLFGFSARFEGSINRDFQWMVTPGVQFGGGVTIFLIQGGVKHTLQQTPVYFAAEVGPVIGNFQGSEVQLGFTPSIGYRANEQWDLSFVVYTGGLSTFVGFRAAYIFRHKK